MSEDLLKEIKSLILSGDSKKIIEIIEKAMKYYSIEDIINKGILEAWKEFSKIYEKNPIEAFKIWDISYLATKKALKVIESHTKPGEEIVIIATAKSEGHLLMKEIVTTYIKSLGFNVISSKGINIDDLKNPLVKFLVLSCTQDDTEKELKEIIEKIRSIRSDLKIIAGGRIADRIGADYVVSDLLELKNILLK
ncbi:MAG: B12-binding domain-containing protein [Candidatus Verstraetearchaeota archaeon]|jgi:methanogenic corrinoid protein MtbC1|nr:B12-binding domain-containing protein [Candidatus Verstraetearchaeota archaeon]